MSGLNHEPFRKEKYATSDAKLEAKVGAIQELPTDTFKNKAVVLSGEKSATEPDVISGRVYGSVRDYEPCTYTLNRQGKRSAWTNKGGDVEVADVIAGDSLRVAQGCDLFPRTALFHQFVRRPNGNWDIRPIERTGELWYLISESKKNLCNDLVAEDFEDEFMYDAFISKHLSPFIMAAPAKGLIPGRKVQGVWKPLFQADLALVNASTEYVFRQIADAVGQDPVPFLSETINIYGKLYKQNFSQDYLVLSSARSCFASRVVCGDCGVFYGSKVWHSTDEYRRTIWRCNNKYTGETKCTTPHVTQEALEKAFVQVMQQVLSQKEEILTACREALDEAFDTTELDKAATRLQDQALGMTARVRQLVEENARVQRDQDEFKKDYEALLAGHAKLSEKIQAIAEQKRDKAERRQRIEIFLHMLEEQKEFCFRNGMKRGCAQ